MRGIFDSSCRLNCSLSKDTVMPMEACQRMGRKMSSQKREGTVKYA
jgi:hypothetical protein